jgi:hypothetical protein
MHCKAKELQEETKIIFQTINKTESKDAEFKLNFKFNENGYIPS